MSRNANPVPVETGAEDEIDLGELLETILDGKWLVLFITLLGAALGVAYALLATPVYQADALVQIEDEGGGNLGALFGEMGEVLAATSPATGEIELIKSRLVLGRTIRELKLYLDVEAVQLPVIGKGLARLKDQHEGRPTPPWMPGADSTGDQYIRVTTFDVPEAYLNKTFVVRAEPTGAGAYALLSPAGMIVARGRAGERLRLDDYGIDLMVSELQADAGQEFELRRLDPLKAVSQLKEKLAVAERGKDSGIIALSFESDNGQQARQVLNNIANNYLRQNVERKGEEAEQTLSYLKNQLPALREKLDASEAELNLYRSSRGSADLMQETEIILEQSAKLEGLRLELAQERKQLLQRFQPSHPTIQALDSQIADVESNRKELEGEIKNLPETQQELLRLTRDVKVNTELYTSLLNSAQQLEVAKAGTVGTVRIIDYAAQPLEPVKPKKSFVVLLSVMLGAILGIGAVFMRRVLVATVDDPQFVEQQLGIPVYANVPVSKDQGKLTQLMKKHAQGLHTLQRGAADGIAIEAIKSLRTSLHFALHEAPNNIVLITGPRPGIGKTFISSNLADAYAMAGKSVIVVDCDMRRGTVHEYMGGKRKPGLADYLVERAELDDVVRSTDASGLFYVTTGTIPPNPSELLSTERFESLLQTLSEQHDVVFLDSPPNLAVADSGILAQRAGCTLMVIAAGVHPPREIAESIKRLNLVGANLKGAVMNMVSQTARRYGYSRYNYYYAYGSKKGR